MTGARDPRGDGPQRVRIPADVDRPDRILAGLTARQLGLLAVPAVVLWAGYAATRRLVPLAVFAALAAPVVVAALVVAFGRRDGLGLDRLLAAALRHVGEPHRLVPAPEGVAPAPAWAGHDPTQPPAPLELPASGVTDAGVIDLGAQGSALICRASAVSFALRTPGEQHAITQVFARYLNSLAAPVQVVARSQPVDLTDAVAELRHAAGGLPHPALERAALSHADFLTQLVETRDLLARQVLVVLRDPVGGDDAAGRLRRRAEDASTALAAAGVTVTVLDAPTAQDCLRGAIDPWAARRPAGIDSSAAVVTGRFD